MSALDSLRWQAFQDVSKEDSWSTEGKNGIPRYFGDPVALQEYQFRVRMREAREEKMEKSEREKAGPLGLRLVDGLRGMALQIARQIPVEVLSSAKGPQQLLKSLAEALRPRRVQEARELYSAGAQTGGVLSRQFTEPVATYLLHLDNELKIPERLLAEQILCNCGLSDDQKLMVRTAIGGDMQVSKVCDELLAQRSRMHENELRRKQSSKGSPTSLSLKGLGKSKGKKWFQSYNSEDVNTDLWQDDWDNQSQSLGGFEDDSTYYSGFEGYAATSDDSPLHQEWEDNVMADCFSSMVADGF